MIEVLGDSDSVFALELMLKKLPIELGQVEEARQDVQQFKALAECELNSDRARFYSRVASRAQRFIDTEGASVKLSGEHDEF